MMQRYASTRYLIQCSYQIKRVLHNMAALHIIICSEPHTRQAGTEQAILWEWV